MLLQANLISPSQLQTVLEGQNPEDPEDLTGTLLIEQGVIGAGELLTFLHQKLLEEQQAYRDNPPPAPAIQFRGVEKHLDGRKVLDGVDLAIPAKRITAIIGVSGGGKSVTLKHIIGLMAPDKGDILIGDQNITGMDAKRLNLIRRRFGMLFQGGALFDSMNVFDNVAFPLRENARLPEDEVARRVHTSLREVNLATMGHKFPDELSGGMLKRAALARALVVRPEFILLDEPTAGLDPIIENAIHHLICDTYMRTRYTMVFISHAVPEIFNWCHHVVALHQGKVLASGPALEIRRSNDPVLKQFINGELTGPIKVI
ncbi:MAG: ATP-binding cassette domain-containing protein [Magnetococcales bacterium]|nr:ATP-binding cassette domain-containing protein [Magnetococcales bacterium]NGZ26319.1 ATP-binding cassette domain-containing protein [Magnetococcales bacterium]